MSRMKIEKIATLEQLIPMYGEQNTQCNALKKVVADLNTKIKNAIKTEDKANQDIVVDGWKCSLTVTEETKINEDKLLEVLKKYKVPVIKTQEYIDSDELERLIYKGEVRSEEHTSELQSRI